MNGPTFNVLMQLTLGHWDYLVKWPEGDKSGVKCLLVTLDSIIPYRCPGALRAVAFCQHAVLVFIDCERLVLISINGRPMALKNVVMGLPLKGARSSRGPELDSPHHTGSSLPGLYSPLPAPRDPTPLAAKGTSTQMCTPKT